MTSPSSPQDKEAMEAARTTLIDANNFIAQYTGRSAQARDLCKRIGQAFPALLSHPLGERGEDNSSPAVAASIPSTAGSPDAADVERAARAIWANRPDGGGAGKPWPLETAEQKRAYPHNPIASVDLCFIYAKAALNA